jgi:hypothetical protein
MARPIRIEYAGAVYHIMACGNQGQKICADDGDRKGYEVYLETRALELGMKAGRRELEEAWQSLRRGWYVWGAVDRGAFGDGL